MTRKILFPLLSICLVAFFVACNKSKSKSDGNCVSEKLASVIKIEGASTAAINEEVPLTISFKCNNGCGQFGKFEETKDGNRSYIKVIARYEGCFCTEDYPTRQTTYTFKASTPGVYILDFYNLYDVLMSKKITVN